MNKEEMKKSVLTILKESVGDQRWNPFTPEELERCANQLTEIAFEVKEASPINQTEEDPDAALDAWRDQQATENEAEQEYHEQQNQEGK